MDLLSFDGAPRKIWDSAFLDGMRCVGDGPADDAVHDMLRVDDQPPEETARVLLRQLLGGGHVNATLGGERNERLQAFFAEHRTLPDWADRNLIEQAQHLCRNNLVVGSVLLGIASLPECYLDARGAPVLVSTGQLSEQPARRLRHTAHFVFSVCDPGGIYPQPWDDSGTLPVGLAKALTVRLMHALIRRLTIEGYRLPESLYREVEDEVLRAGPDAFSEEGAQPVPINQEDQAFVLLTFSYVVVRGLEKMGVKLTPQDRDAYVHLWNVIGHVMGVRRELMPHGYAEAASLFHALKQRLNGPSPEGTALNEAIMGWINALVPRPVRALNPAAELITHFIGREGAEMLGIRHRGMGWLRHRLFTLPLDGFAALKPPHVDFDPLALLVQYLAGPMVRKFMAEVKRQQAPAPPEYAARMREHAAQSSGPSLPDMHQWPDYVVSAFG